MIKTPGPVRRRRRTTTAPTGRAAWTAVAIVATTAIAGCVPVPTPKADCTQADPALVRTVMSGAIENGRPTPTSTFIDHIEDDGGYIERLPAAERRFGVTHVLGIRTTIYFGGPDSSDSIPGVVGPAIFFLDDDERVIGAIHPIDYPTYRIPVPKDPEFATWAGRALSTSTTVGAVYDCSKP